MTLQLWVAVVIGVAATVEDLVHRRISNWICGTALVAGLALHILSDGWRGGVSSLLGVVAGFCIFLIFYVLGGMGGGDVKLMAGFGAILGLERLFAAALWTGALGGIFAALAIGFNALHGLLRASIASEAGAPAIAARRPLRSIPYAPAIAAGVWLSLLPKA